MPSVGKHTKTLKTWDWPQVLQPGWSEEGYAQFSAVLIYPAVA